MADTKISEATRWFGLDESASFPAAAAQLLYDSGTDDDINNVLIPVSVPGDTSPKTVSLAALQALGQICVYVGEDILNPVLGEENNRFFTSTLKNILVYTIDSGIVSWAPAWLTYPSITNTRGMIYAFLCYTVNGVMVTINTTTKEVTKRNILPSMGVGSDVEIGSGLLSASSVEFDGMTNHFDVGDTVRKDNGDGTASFYRLNSVTTDSEGNQTAEWESLSDLKHKEDYTVWHMIEGILNRGYIEGTLYFPVTDEEAEFLKSEFPVGVYYSRVPAGTEMDPVYMQAERTNESILKFVMSYRDIPTSATFLKDVNRINEYAIDFNGYNGTVTLIFNQTDLILSHSVTQGFFITYESSSGAYQLCLKYKGAGSNVLCDNGKYATPQSIVFKPNEVTTLAGLPIDKYGIKATVTEATSMSFASAPSEGMEYIVDILNDTSSDIEQPLPNGDEWQVPKDSITLVAGKVTEISVRYVFGKYVVKA